MKKGGGGMGVLLVSFKIFKAPIIAHRKSVAQHGSSTNTIRTIVRAYFVLLLLGVFMLTDSCEVN